MKSDTGASIAFLDTINTFKGWKTILDKKDAWIQYNAVDFGSKKYKSVQLRASSQKEPPCRFISNKADGPLLSEVKIPASRGWNIVDSRILKFQPGIHNLVVVVMDNYPVEIDWIQFTK